MQIAAMAATKSADYFTPTPFLHRLLAGADFMVAASATFDGPPSGSMLGFGYATVVACVLAVNGVLTSPKPFSKSLVT